MGEAASDAWATARAAGDLAGVTVSTLTTLEKADHINAVIEAVWGGQHLHREMIRALQHSGNAPIGAFQGEQLIGFALGFAGTAGGLHVHSHMAAVVPGTEHRGVGYALKLGQRAACLDQGIEEVRWTYDPLVARNGRFNLVKLGAVATEFRPEFYGRMTDLINEGDRSDRFEVVWRLRSPRVERLAKRGPPKEVPTPEGVRLLVAEGDPRCPSPRATDIEPADVTLVAVPRDHAALKAADPVLAAEWRDASARAFGACFGAGLVATALTSGGEYVFLRPEEAV